MFHTKGVLDHEQRYRPNRAVIRVNRAVIRINRRGILQTVPQSFAITRAGRAPDQRGREACSARLRGTRTSSPAVISHPWLHVISHPWLHAISHPWLHAISHPWLHVISHPWLHVISHPWLHLISHPWLHAHCKLSRAERHEDILAREAGAATHAKATEAGALPKPLSQSVSQAGTP